MAIPTSAPRICDIDFSVASFGELLLNHHTFDVFHYYDSVIDQQTYRQHHAKHRQRVDGVAKHRQYREGAQQHHGYGNGWNERCAHVLQEQIHDKKYENNCFKSVLTTS